VGHPRCEHLPPNRGADRPLAAASNVDLSTRSACHPPEACLRFGMRSWASRGHAGLRGGVSAELADDDRTWCRAIPTPRRTPWTQRACETDRRDSRTSEADTCSVLPEPDHLDPRPQPVHPPAAVTVPTRAGAHGVPAPAGTADIIRATVTWCRPTGTGVGRRELWIVGVVLPDIR
jgi:hypothetical protein